MGIILPVQFPQTIACRQYSNAGDPLDANLLSQPHDQLLFRHASITDVDVYIYCRAIHYSHGIVDG